MSRASISITSVVLLILLGIGAAVLLWLWLAPHAASPGKPLPRLEVSVEAVKAYVIPNYGSYIGLFVRNIGKASIPIRLLEDKGLAVYVYDWKGDLIAVNNSARIVREGVPDGVWSPGELVVIEAFVPVELGYASLDTPGTGYRIALYIGGQAGQGTEVLEATLPISSIVVVNVTPVVCGIILAPGSSITLPSGSVTAEPLSCTNSTVSNLVGSKLIDVQLEIVPLNESTSIAFQEAGGDTVGNSYNILILQINSASLTADNTTATASITVNNKYTATASLPPLKPGEPVTITYGATVDSAVVYALKVTLGGRSIISGYSVTSNMTAYVGLGDSKTSITVDTINLGGVDTSGAPIDSITSVYGYTLDVVSGYVLVKSIVERIAAVGNECKPVIDTLVYYNGGSSLPTGVTIQGSYKIGCVETGVVFTPPWRG